MYGMLLEVYNIPHSIFFCCIQEKFFCGGVADSQFSGWGHNHGIQTVYLSSSTADVRLVSSRSSVAIRLCVVEMQYSV